MTIISKKPPPPPSKLPPPPKKPVGRHILVTCSKCAHKGSINLRNYADAEANDLGKRQLESYCNGCGQRTLQFEVRDGYDADSATVSAYVDGDHVFTHGPPPKD